MNRCYVAAVGLMCLLFAPAAESRAQSKTELGTANWHAEGKKGAVCVGGNEARDASLEMLKSGGNAVDAAVVATTAAQLSKERGGMEVPLKELRK
jgi:gamma-glutamyltranspeptidase